MKTDGHLGRCYREGRDGDAANVVLSAVGHNLRLVLAWLRMPLRLILNVLSPLLTARTPLKWASYRTTRLFRSPCGASTNTTGVPFLILPANRPTSQFVNRTQPWDSVLLTLEGSGVPWIPYPS